MDASWAAFGGGSIYIETSGRGHDAIFMPVAWGASHDFHKVLLCDVDVSLCISYFDPQGTGMSGGMPAGWTPAQIVDEAEAVRESLGLDQVVLMGHESGAFLSLAYALEHPQRVKAMILISPFASYQRANSMSVGRLESNPNWAAFQKRVADIRRVRLLADDRFRAIFKEQRAVDMYNYGPHYFQMANAADEATFNPAMHDDTETDLLDELHHIEVPVLIVTGVDDPLSPMEESRLIADALPFVRLIELEACGHYPYVEQPELFADAIDQFLTDVSDELLPSGPDAELPANSG